MCARARVSGIFDVINEVMIDSKIDRYDSSERKLAKENIEEMLTILKGKKSILLIDRGYMKWLRLTQGEEK